MNKIVDYKIIEANQYVHASLVKMKEYNKSPHFRPENQEKVRKILIHLKSLLQSHNSLKLIDFGCGTGFIINLGHDLFDEIHGVDITKEMLEQVDISPGNIFLHESLAEATSFENETFDFATAYSFMDHLGNYEVFLEEVYRVLKKGGIFYSDLNPNKDYIDRLSNLEKNNSIYVEVTDFVKKEIKGALHNGKQYAEEFGLNEELLLKAEPIKSFQKGFDGHKVLQKAYEIGFSKCYLEYEWFMGEGLVLHSEMPSNVKIIGDYLKSLTPFSSMFFKYLRFVFIK